MRLGASSSGRQAACLKAKLLQSAQTRQGIDNVAANNAPPSCAQLMAKYDGSKWWWGAFGNCKRPSGPTERNAIFECAWAQVPAADKTTCLKAKLLQSDQTRRGIDNVAANNGSIANNFSTVQQKCADDPNGGCPEACDLPHDGSVPSQYFVLQIPQSLLDAPAPGNQTFNDPPAHNIGANEGRLRDDLRMAARVADPLGCSLHLSAVLYARASVDQSTEAHSDLETAQAYADLSVTGHNAFKKFRRDLPAEPYCQTLATRAFADKCPAVGVPPSAAALVSGCHQALDRAYKVANFLRAGQALRIASPWFTPNGEYTREADLEQRRKRDDRNALGWIAVSGEDDSPRRPVNVPSSDFAQYDLDFDVPAPAAVPPGTVHVHTRFVVSQSKGPAPETKPATGWSLAPDPVLTIPPDAQILLFIHGMDSRAEEANDITNAMFKLMVNSKKTLVVISVDLPTSGYADNLDYDRVSPLSAIGNPKWTVLPVPISVPAGLLFGIPGFPHILPAESPIFAIPPGTPIPDFAASGKTPLLDFIEDFIVRFVDALDTVDQKHHIKGQIKAVMGGSLGGNMAFRLGRRPNVPWIPNVIVWSPASIWDSMGEGMDVSKHIAPRTAWEGANTAHKWDATDPGDQAAARAGLRQAFFGSWDTPIIPGLIPAQSETWTSDYYKCKKSSVAAARLDRHETYDPKFLAWHWRLGGEQLLYSHQTKDPATGQPRFMSNHKRMLLACGTEDHVLYNDICGATQRTAPHMTTTPGKALFLEKTGHSLDNERRDYWAQHVVEFLSLR
jgi:hypothetical protein